MSLRNPSTKDIQDGSTATIVGIEKPIMTFISTPIRRLVCLFKGHTKTTFLNKEGQKVATTCLRCWKKYK